ncbi:hypothetical protein MUP77_02310, partial [Candidatus Bathyarchaeota archaeon]|nr:hypothetical protein [Candidatus Bathyarchaeota archaeon]
EKKLQQLKVKGIKVGRPKRFRSYDYLAQSSVLKIAENIGNIVGYENVTVEPGLSQGDAGIKFIDNEVYYLQIKSPLFFESKYGSKFSDVSREFQRILSKSRSRFAVGYATKSTLIPVHVENVRKSGRRASLGILAYDNSFVPTPDISRKVTEMLDNADKQLSKIREKSLRVFVLDVTHYQARGNLDFYNLLAKIFKSNRDTLKVIDGIALFSWNPIQTNDSKMPLALIPIFLKTGIISKVFRQPFQLYRGLMITLPTNMCVRKGWNNLLEINKEGYMGVDGVEYGPFWRSVDFLSAMNQTRDSRHNA